MADGQDKTLSERGHDGEESGSSPVIHKFDPRTMKLPYVEEINYYMEMSHKLNEPLVLCEWDIEYAPEVAERLLQYVKKEPEKPHVGPYLTNIYFETSGNAVLFWAHRLLREGVKIFTIEEGFTKVSKTVTARVRYPAWVAGGEPEADIVCLGFTYLPYEFWQRIYPEIKTFPWNVLDIEISARMLREGLKGRIHWDCVVNHLHINIRENEKSVFRKWVGIDKNPLSQSEKDWLKVDRLPRYHGFLSEPMLADKETKSMVCPKCQRSNNGKELVHNRGNCKNCGQQVADPYTWQVVDVKS
jgi:hypothetical protein